MDVKLHYRRIKAQEALQLCLGFAERWFELEYGKRLQECRDLTLSDPAHELLAALEDSLETEDPCAFLNWLFELNLTSREFCYWCGSDDGKPLCFLLERIAQEAKLLDVRPVRLLGKPCRSAGLFLALKADLWHAGFAVDSLTPSSSLSKSLSHDPLASVRTLTRFFPNRLPPLRLDKASYLRIGAHETFRDLIRSMNASA